MFARRPLSPGGRHRAAPVNRLRQVGRRAAASGALLPLRMKIEDAMTPQVFHSNGAVYVVVAPKAYPPSD